MTLRNITGFKTVEIKGNTFTFNRQVIKFKGVNHHDTNGKTGYVMTFDDYEKDVKLIKEYNGNAIRTSHYPPRPVSDSSCRHIRSLYSRRGGYRNSRRIFRSAQ